MILIIDSFINISDAHDHIFCVPEFTFILFLFFLHDRLALLDKFSVDLTIVVRILPESMANDAFYMLTWNTPAKLRVSQVERAAFNLAIVEFLVSREAVIFRVHFLGADLLFVTKFFLYYLFKQV